MKEKCLGPMRTLIRPWPVHVFMPEQSGFERLCLIFFLHVKNQANQQNMQIKLSY